MAGSKFNPFENWNDVTCNKHELFLKLCKMAVPFKLNNTDFLSLSFSTVSKSIAFVFATLSFAAACKSSSYVCAFSLKSLSEPTNVYDETDWSSIVYLNKLVRLSKPVCLSNVHSSKPNISSKFYPSKPDCPRNITSSRSICSSDVFQSNNCPIKPA